MGAATSASGTAGATSTAGAASTPGAAASGGATASGATAGGASTSGAAASGGATAGGASTSGAAASGPIKIGVLEPLTGSFASTAKDNQDGMNLYLSTVSDSAAGRKIELTFADTQGQPTVALTKAKQMVDSDHVQALMGITPTPVCYAMADYVKTAHVPLIVSANCSAQNLFSQHGSPYLVRITQTNVGMADPAADWAYKNGLRKAILFTADYGGGLEISDTFASAFIERGGTVVQELHPALGAADYGPLLAQLDPSADVIWTFLPGADGLRFGQQYGNYAGSRKTTVMEAFADITAGPNLTQLKDKAVGLVASNIWTEALYTPPNQAFIKAFQAKYPGRLLSKDVVQGYVGAQVLEEAINKVNGRIEDVDPFMQALFNINIQTAKGPVKLDKDHDIVQDDYIYQTVKNGSGYQQKLLATYKDTSDFWDRTPDEVARLKIGTRKGQWVGMTKAKLDQIIKG